MIQINHPRLEEWALSLYHDFFVKEGFEAKLRNCAIDPHWSKDQIEFLQYLLSHSKTVISGRPHQLAVIINHIQQTYKGKRKIFNILVDPKTKKCLLKKALQDIYNYESFSKNERTKWGAYYLTERLKVSVCPYCNRQFTTNYHSKSGRTRPQLDHFYGKAKHPYLAVSFFNLIPSCYVCNANLKGQKAFTLETHLHPYKEGFGNYRKFGVEFKVSKSDIDYIGIFEGKLDGFNIVFRDDPNLDRQDSYWIRVNNNCDVFKIKELYNEHKHYVSNLIMKNKIYNNAHIHQLMSTFPELFSTEFEVLRFISGAPLSEEDYSQKTLSKMTVDVVEDLKLRFT